jgi:hypothetical protein
MVAAADGQGQRHIEDCFAGDRGRSPVRVIRSQLRPAGR